MTNKEQTKLIKAQQGELDAVVLYKTLADILKETQYKKIFLEIAADEGKHAGILKNYTGINLNPRPIKAKIIAVLYRVIGLQRLVKIIEKGEFNAAKDYESLVGKYPNIRKIIEDENRHGKLMQTIC